MMSKSKSSNKKAKPAGEGAVQQQVKDKSPYVHQREKINFPLNLKGLDWTEKQKAVS